MSPLHTANRVADFAPTTDSMHLYLLRIEFEESICTKPESKLKYEEIIGNHFIGVSDLKVHPRGWSIEVTLRGNNTENTETLEKSRQSSENFMPKIKSMYFPFCFPLNEANSFKRLAEECRKRLTQ